MFMGREEPAREWDCVLIYDEDMGVRLPTLRFPVSGLTSSRRAPSDLYSREVGLIYKSDLRPEDEPRAKTRRISYVYSVCTAVTKSHQCPPQRFRPHLPVALRQQTRVPQQPHDQALRLEPRPLHLPSRPSWNSGSKMQRARLTMRLPPSSQLHRQQPLRLLPRIAQPKVPPLQARHARKYRRQRRLQALLRSR